MKKIVEFYGSFCFSFLCEGFVFYCNIIWSVFYLVENANMDGADEQILNNNCKSPHSIKLKTGVANVRNFRHLFISAVHVCILS